MEKSELKERFYTQIEAELSLCDSKVTPLICYNYQNPIKKNRLIETIAETSIRMKLSISEAIVHIERNYSVNSID